MGRGGRGWAETSQLHLTMCKQNPRAAAHDGQKRMLQHQPATQLPQRKPHHVLARAPTHISMP